MERISIFNYEAFYLDYLEGNLSEEDTAMLMQFFETHPECRLEVEELVSLEDDVPVTFFNKQSLKQVDEAGEVNLENIEHFMIADAEGVLAEDKSNELNAVIGDNPALIATMARYKSVYFEPDHTLIYKDKQSLRRRRSIVLWPYVSGAAAAAILAFVFFTNTGDMTFDKMDYALGNWNPETPEFQLNNGTNGVNENPNNTIVAEVTGSNGMSIGQHAKSKGTPKQVLEGGSLKARPIEPLTRFDQRTLVPVTQYNPRDIVVNPVVAENVPVDNKNDLSMNNPIPLITNFISEKSNTEVDFRQRKATTDKKGGFLIKIGKFEVSRNRH